MSINSVCLLKVNCVEPIYGFEISTELRTVPKMYIFEIPSSIILRNFVN